MVPRLDSKEFISYLCLFICALKGTVQQSSTNHYLTFNMWHKRHFQILVVRVIEESFTVCF